MLGGRDHPQEADLADLHAWVDSDRKVRNVRKLEGEISVKPGVNKSSCGMDQQTEAAETGLALDPTHQVIWQRDPFERRAQDELTRVQDQRLFADDLDEFGQLLLIF